MDQICIVKSNELLVAFLLLWLFLIPRALALNVPIYVSELIPSDVQGISRQNEPVTFGFPLKNSDNISDIQDLSVVDDRGEELLSQMRILKRYPSGNIKWILVDTEVSIEAGEEQVIYIVDRNRTSSSENVIADEGSYFRVNTGSAVFNISKTNFNLLESVFVEDVSFLGDSEGLVLYDKNKRYILSDNVNVFIEENGPIKGVLCVKGNFEDEQGSVYLSYLIRMYFYRHKKYCIISYTLKNAGDFEVKEEKLVKEFGLSFSINPNLTGEISYRFARADVQNDIIGLGSGFLFQGYVGNFDVLDNRATHTILTSQDGVEINNSVYNEPSQGYFQVCKGDKCINCAMAFMGGYWPAGFEVSEDGVFKIDTYSPRNNTDVYLGWGQYQTRRAIVEFDAQDISPKETLYKLQYPLMGRALFSWYRDTGAVFDNTNLISVEEERQWLLKYAPEEISFNFDKGSSNMQIERKYHWATTGGFQNDWAEVDLIDWIRTGNALYFNRARESVRFRCDDAIIHTDGFNFKESPPDISNNSHSYVSFFDWAHIFWESMPLMYYLTGDELIRDSLEDLMEWLDYDSSATIYRAQFNVGAGDLRSYSRIFKAIALLAEFFENQDLLDTLVMMAKQYVGYEGRSKERGFFDIRCEPTLHVLRDFFVTRIHADAIYQVWRVLSEYRSEELSLLEDISDIMLGWGYFLFNEFVNNGHTVYAYKLYEANEFSYRAGDVNWFLSRAYDLTGQNKFLGLRPGVWLAAQQRGAGVYSERFVQSFIYRDINHTNLQCGYISPFGDGRIDMQGSNITKYDNGVYILHWTEPVDNITKYQIKFSDHPLVENLEFHQDTREYTYNPDQYDNFWAAMNVNNEPEPKGMGMEQVMEINVKSVIEEYNNKYHLQEGDSGYVFYNANRRYYFAIKYWYNLLQDVNQDGQVNISDVQLVVNVILGNATNSRADVNGDGNYTVSDAQEVVNGIVN